MSDIIAFPRTPRVAANINAALGCETGAPHPDTLDDADREIVLMAVLRGIAALGPQYQLHFVSSGRV